MTTAMRLTGPWEGLRAYPRGFRTPDSRQRMEAALERLQHHRERFDRHINRAQSAIARIDALCDDAIARLDASDPDADLEPDGSDEPSLGAVEGTITVTGVMYVLSQDELSRWEPINHADREEEDEHDEASLCGVRYGAGDSRDREGEHDGSEASLCGVTFGAPYAEFGLHPHDGEDEHDGREPDAYDEPSLTALDRHGGNQCGSRWIGGGAGDDREDDADGDEESEVGQ